MSSTEMNTSGYRARWRVRRHSGSARVACLCLIQWGLMRRRFSAKARSGSAIGFAVAKKLFITTHRYAGLISTLLSCLQVFAQTLASARRANTSSQ